MRSSELPNIPVLLVLLFRSFKMCNYLLLFHSAFNSLSKKNIFKHLLKYSYDFDDRNKINTRLLLEDTLIIIL